MRTSIVGSVGVIEGAKWKIYKLKYALKYEKSLDNNKVVTHETKITGIEKKKKKKNEGWFAWFVTCGGVRKTCLCSYREYIVTNVITRLILLVALLLWVNSMFQYMKFFMSQWQQVRILSSMISFRSLLED